MGFSRRRLYRPIGMNSRWATLATTPDGESGEADFSGSMYVVIPETGDIPNVELVAKGVKHGVHGAKAISKQPRLEVRAFDESGKALQDFEIQLNGPAFGTSSEPPFGTRHTVLGAEGLAVMTDYVLKGWKHGELIVSAPGYASTILESAWFDGLKKIAARLERGFKVRLRISDANGKPIVPEVMPLPQVYLARHRGDAGGSRSLSKTPTLGREPWSGPTSWVFAPRPAEASRFSSHPNRRNRSISDLAIRMCFCTTRKAR